MKNIKNILCSGFSLLLAMVIMSTVVFAAEASVYNNTSGQRQIDVTNGSYTMLTLVGRGGNVYDVTHQRLITSSCKGVDYFTVATGTDNSLIIMWVDSQGYLWRTPAIVYQPICKGAWSGSALNTVTQGVQASVQQNINYQQSYPNYQPYYYQQQVYNQQNQNTSNYQSDDKGYYKLSSDDLYWYSSNGSNKTKLVSNVDEMAKIDDDYIIYRKDDNLYYIEYGEKNKGEFLMDEVDDIKKSSSDKLRYVITEDDEEYDEDDIRDLIDDDDDDDDDDDRDYPYVRKSGSKYTLYKSSSRKYRYEIDDDEVTYDDDVIYRADDHDDDDVDCIAFTSKYVYIFTDSGDLYQAKLGEDEEAELVEENIEKFYESGHIFKYLKDEDGDKQYPRDYE